MRTRLEGDPTFLEMLRRQREVCLGAFAHQDVPFEKIVEEMGGERQQSHPPVFQVAFGVRHAPRGAAQELRGLSIEGIHHGAETGRFDLTLWVVEVGGQLRAEWTYNTDLFEGASVERMNRRYERLLRSVVDDPEKRVSELEMRTGDEVRAEEEERRARLAKNASRLKGMRRKPVEEAQTMLAVPGDLAESVAADEQ
jgi:non-ribosomal peptide synthetase component F